MLGPALKLAAGAPWDTMIRWAKEYGSIYKFSLFGQVNVVMSDPSFMKEVMRTKVRSAHLDADRCLSACSQAVPPVSGPHPNQCMP